MTLAPSAATVRSMGMSGKRMKVRGSVHGVYRPRLLSVAVTALVLGSCVALGCDSDDDARTDARAGAGGLSGGRAGAHSGGAGTSGEVGGDGLGGAGGAAGAASVGGEGGLAAGMGGTAGEGGQGGQGPRFDPACECVFFDSFTCTLPLNEFSRRNSTPSSSCDDDVDYYRIETCADGTTRHSWLEGGENAYTMVYSGRLIYASAFGYVGHVCGTGDDVAVVSSGEPPAASECEICTVCQGDHVEGGAPGSCD